MTFTVGLLLVFLNIFLSGLIFLRFYFIGEFSKQFNTRIPIIRLAFYALLPGLILSSLGVLVYSWWDDSFKMNEALEIYVNLLQSEGEFAEPTIYFLNHQLTSFVLYNVIIYVVAALTGFLMHYFIQKWNWDKKSKLFRYKNPWYYIFSGEILKFKKFLKASEEVAIKAHSKNQKTIVTYADILCEENGGTKLYTGYLVDYELNAENTHELDKIYLLDAKRYEKNEKTGLIDNSSTSVHNINGNLFVIDYKRVINLNLTYVPSFKQLTKLHQGKNKRTKLLLRSFLWLRFIAILTVLDFVWFHLILQFDFVDGLTTGAKVALTLTLMSGLSVLIFMFQLLQLKEMIKMCERELEYLKSAIREKRETDVGTKSLVFLQVFDKKQKHKSNFEKLEDLRNASLGGFVFLILIFFLLYFTRLF